jgi:hypothetical protein
VLLDLAVAARLIGVAAAGAITGTCITRTCTWLRLTRVVSSSEAEASVPSSFSSEARHRGISHQTTPRFLCVLFFAAKKSENIFLRLTLLVFYQSAT